MEILWAAEHLPAIERANSGENQAQMCSKHGLNVRNPTCGLPATHADAQFLTAYLVPS
jgi:hypothetical protein